MLLVLTSFNRVSLFDQTYILDAISILKLVATSIISGNEKNEQDFVFLHLNVVCCKSLQSSGLSHNVQNIILHPTINICRATDGNLITQAQIVFLE